MSVITYKFRVKNGVKRLDVLAIQCNQVWNFCVATQREAERRYKAGISCRWPTWVDLCKLCAGSSALLGIHSDTVASIVRQFAKSRDQHRKCPRFRTSFGTRRALGWVPYIPRAATLGGGKVGYLKRKYSLWQHRPIEGMFLCGAFVQDARGRWYATFACEVENTLEAGAGEIGIDLGLKSFATLSTGRSIETPRIYRKHEIALGKAQRAGNKVRARAIHAKIANCRRHFLHVESSRIARENHFIAVGDVNAASLAKTKLAKSVLDAGWSSFRRMLQYKSARRRAAFVEVNEAFSTQACSACGCISGPKGRAGLSKRQWVCGDCGVEHDRDVNAAINILVAGRNAALRLTKSHAL